MKTNFFGIERKESETDWEFCFRCVRAKINKDIDVDYQDIIDYFDLGIARDSLRKAVNVSDFSAVKVAEYYENKIENMNCVERDSSIDELLLELENKKLEIKAERTKLSTLRSDLNKTVRENSRKELFYENLREAIISSPLDPIEFDLCCEQDNKKEYLLTFADVHYGADFNVGFNTYSPEICKNRFNQLYNDVVELIEDKGIGHLKIASCGDLIQGIIRISDLSLNSITMIEQIMGISRLVSEFLNNLASHCKITYYHTINANHSELRLLGTKSGELSEDVELLIGNYIKDLLVNNGRINVVIGNDTVTDIALCGYEIGLTHGQHIKNKETFIRDLSVTRHKNYDFLILGHIHHYTCVTVSTGKDGSPTQVISVPSIVGSCPYSKKIMKTCPSGALLIEFTEEKGKTCTHEITLK